MRQIVIHRSLNRSIDILGGDRELVLSASFIAVVVAFTAFTWWGVSLAAAFWLGAVYILRAMYKADPHMRHVFARHRTYKEYYPAKSAVDRVIHPDPSAWKI